MMVIRRYIDLNVIVHFAVIIILNPVRFLFALGQLQAGVGYLVPVNVKDRDFFSVLLFLEELRSLRNTPAHWNHPLKICFYLFMSGGEHFVAGKRKIFRQQIDIFPFSSFLLWENVL